jgi:DNA invertase Pin-like site-specific DNA recombinase
MSVASDLRKILKKTGKPKRQIYMELKISSTTFYNIINNVTKPRSQLFFEKLESLKKKYGVK